jgi:hypothetical protein
VTALLRTPLDRLIEKATGFTLSPAQRALVAIGTGKRLQDLRGEVRAAAEQALGYERGPNEAMSALYCACGARAGKTLICSYLATWRALVVDLSGTAPGEMVKVGFLSASMKQAEAALRYSRSFISACGLDRIVMGKGSLHRFVIRREGGRLIEFSLMRGNAGGDPIAGSWWAALVVNECAVAVDPSGGQPILLDEIERAVRPRLLPARGASPGGLFIMESTGRSDAGPAWDRVRDNYGKPEADTVIFRASTLTLRPDDEALRRLVEREYLRDPESAQREFEAEFSPVGGGASYVFTRAVLDPIALDTMDVNQPPAAQLESYAGVDLAFTADGSALAIVRKRSPTDFHLAALRRWRPTRHAPLQPSVVIGELLDELERHGTRTVVADVHHFAQLAEAAAQRRNIRVLAAPNGAQGKCATHDAALELFSGGNFKMGRDHLLLRSLMRIVATRTPDGAVKIRSPRGKSGHGDDASALVLAAYAAHLYGGHRRDPAFVPRAPSIGMQQLGILDSNGQRIGPSAAEFSINAYGHAEARPARPRSDWEGRGTFDKGGF